MLNMKKLLGKIYLKKFVEKSAITMLKCCAPVMAVAAIVSFLSNVAQIGLLFCSTGIRIKLERINPLSGVKKTFFCKIFSRRLKGNFKIYFYSFYNLLFFERRYL